MFSALVLAALGFTSATAGRIDAIVASELAAHRAPGIAVGVVESGRLVYARGFGSANLSRHTAASPGTEFGIGQISEQFTAAAVLLLAQDGRLHLDDQVTKYVPELTVARGVTIRQLLDQTSGLPYVGSWEHLIAAANAGHPAATPGSVYAANPLNYLVAGLIVSRVAGEPLSDYVEQHIFVPLVMDASLFSGDTGLSSDRATGYTLVGGRFVRAQPWSSTRLGGDAAIVSDVYDLSKWDIEFPILLRDDAVRDMFSPGIASAFDRHGMGWTLDQRSGRRFVWQNGEIPGFHAMNALLPDDHVAVIVLVNVDSRNEQATLPESIAGRILDAVAPPSRQRVDNAVVSRAREFLMQIESGRIDRTQLTPSFSRYLTDDLVHRADIGLLGNVESFIPISSSSGRGGETTYEFLVQFSRGERHYRVTFTPDGKIDYLTLNP